MNDTFDLQSGIPHTTPTSLSDVGYAGHLLRKFKAKNTLTSQIIVTVLLGADKPLSIRDIGAEIANQTYCIVTIPSINSIIRRLKDCNLVVVTDGKDHNQPNRFSIHPDVEDTPKPNTLSISDEEIATLKRILSMVEVKDD